MNQINAHKKISGIIIAVLNGGKKLSKDKSLIKNSTCVCVRRVGLGAGGISNLSQVTPSPVKGVYLR